MKEVISLIVLLPFIIIFLFIGFTIFLFIFFENILLLKEIVKSFRDTKRKIKKIFAPHNKS